MNERNLLEAGAVLPLAAGSSGRAAADGDVPAAGSSGGAAQDGDVLVARGYRHPALDGRVVVRLVPEALVAAEDLALEFLGFDADAADAAPSAGSGSSGSGGTARGGGRRVGRVQRQALGFPAWALVHDPANGRHALDVVKEMERLARMAVAKPGHAKDGFDEIGVRLDRSVPHFLPTYYEQVARHFLAAEAATYASAFFGKAREAERRHALAVDEERLRQVFLEFAAAGALSGKTLREQARGLGERLSPQDAFEQFRILCLERSGAGLAPYAGMIEDLRRLARAAGHDVAAEEVRLVSELLRSGAVSRAPLSFWKAARPALVGAARQDPAVRARLLRLLPSAGGEQSGEFDEMWLETLESAGAFALLAAGPAASGAQLAPGAPAAPDGADEEQPPGAAQWFSAWAVHRRRGWRQPPRMASELRLVERFAAQLAAEGEPVQLTRSRGHRAADLDLLDTCLAAGVPVAAPGDQLSLDLEPWLTDERPGRRDLAAILADARFTRLLGKAVEALAGASSANGSERLRRIATDPVLGEAVRRWLELIADELSGPLGLPGLTRLLGRVDHFTDRAALATAPGAVARISAVDVAPVLAGTLRAGILDELGWPALDEAVRRLATTVPPGAKPVSNGSEGYQLDDAWPALLISHGTHAIAVGPDGVLDERVLTLPAPLRYQWDGPTIRWVDGQWLIASGRGDERRAAWSGRSADTFRPQGTLDPPRGGAGSVSLPLPGGGRFYGTRPMHAGDTSFGDRRPVASDGISYWALHDGRWYEYDPATARRGRASVPAFFDSALAEGVAGAALLEYGCQLLPLQPGLADSPFGSRDGQLGWWIRYDSAAGTLTACSVDGSRSPARPCPLGAGADVARVGNGALPLPPLRLPGGNVLHTVAAHGHWGASITVLDSDGVELGSVVEGRAGGVFAGGTAVVAPLRHWHALRARDAAGSAVLRAVTDAQAAALITAVTDGADPEAAVRAALPGITHPGLVEGVAALTAAAARTARRVTAFAKKAVRAAEPAAAPKAPVAHARDGVLSTALAGLLDGGRAYGYYGYHGRQSDEATTAIDQLRALHRAVDGTITDDAPPQDEEDDEQPVAAPQTRNLFARHALRGSNVNWPTVAGAGLAAAALRAASPATGEQEREALLEFLDTALDGPVPLADPRGRLRVVELCEPRSRAGSRIGHVLRDGGGSRSDGAGAGRTLLILRSPRTHDDREHWTGVEYAHDGDFGGWEGFKLVEEEIVGAPGDPERTAGIRRLAALVRERGPVPYRPEVAERFAELTGVDVSSAALLLLGLPGVTGYGRDGLPGPEVLALAGLRPARAATARDALRRLSVSERFRLLGSLVPTDTAAVERLWADGQDADALSEEWFAIHGRQRRIPIELVERANRETQLGEFLSHALNPELRSELTGLPQRQLTDSRHAAGNTVVKLSGASLAHYVTALRWLAYRLPYGDPLRAALPVTLRMLRERLADEDLLLELGVDWTPEGKPSSHRIREAYGLPPAGGAAGGGPTSAGPAIVLQPSPYASGSESVWLRTAALLPGAADDAGPGHPALVLLAGLRPDSSRLQALRDVLGEELPALVSADGPAGAPQDPARSVPELVGEAAGRLGLSADAAALYLMLLALPDPADRQVAAWTGWKPARTKKAHAELAATELVVAAKRARAGRTLFLPGGWLDHKAPRLPTETWKAAVLAPEQVAADGFVVPRCTVPELFRRAWQRVVAGDAPGFEEFTGRRAGRTGGRR